jgi:hypothetical protein
MTIDERKRHALYERLDEVLDDEHADTLMELLPPVGWADVATKQDLEILRSEMRAGFSDVRAELHRELRQQLWAILGSLLVAVVVSQVLSRLG